MLAPVISIAQFQSETPNCKEQYFKAKDSVYQGWNNQQLDSSRSYKIYRRNRFLASRLLNNDCSSGKPKLYHGKSLKSGGSWKFVGPTYFTTSHGLNVAPGIGRIDAIAFDPADSNTIWVGAPSGGLWKTSNGGNTWTVLTDQLPTLGISAIAIHPSNPNIIYIGTGDGIAPSYSSSYSIGILKSKDGGQTWDSTGMIFGLQQLQNITKILINPKNPNVLLASTGNGIWKSNDGGNSWSQSVPGDFNDLVFKPGDEHIVYASTDQFYVSTDTGNTFNLVTAGLPSASASGKMKIAVSNANPSMVWVLAASAISGPAPWGSYGPGTFLGLYQSANSGSTFTQITSTPNLLSRSITTTSNEGTGLYCLDIAVSPNSVNELYVGGYRIFKSTDGGNTWNINTSEVFDPNHPYVHGDIQTLEWRGNQLYVGCDGGVYRSNDTGSTYLDLSDGIATSMVFKLGVHDSIPTKTMCGTQDNGTMLYKPSGSWPQSLGGDGWSGHFHPTIDSVIYTSTANGKIFKSLDGGITETEIAAGPRAADGVQYAYFSPFEMAKYDPDILYIAFSNVYKSTNGGGTWNALSSGSTSDVRFMTLSTNEPGKLYIATKTKIYRTNNDGGLWSIAYTGLPTNIVDISSIYCKPNQADTIWATFSGYVSGQKVYRSNDGGASWTNVSANLPNIPMNCIVHEIGSAGGLYVGTDLGVYYTNDTISSWIPFNNGLPKAIVNDLKIVYGSTNKIKAGTYGRGVWESNLFGQIATNSTMTQHEFGLDLRQMSDREFLIRFPEGHQSGQIIAYNLAGQPVYYSIVTGTQTTIHLKNVSIGMYIVQFLNHGYSYSRKLVISR